MRIVGLFPSGVGFRFNDFNFDVLVVSGVQA